MSEYPQTRCISWRSDSVTDITACFYLHIICIYYFPFLSILSPFLFLFLYLLLSNLFISVTSSYFLSLRLHCLVSVLLSSSAYLLYSHIPYILPSFPYIFFLPTVLYLFVFTFPILSLTTTHRHCTNNLIAQLNVPSLAVRRTKQRLNYHHVASQIHIMNLPKDSHICVAMACNSKVCQLHGLNASGEADERSFAGNSCFS